MGRPQRRHGAAGGGGGRLCWCAPRVGDEGLKGRRWGAGMNGDRWREEVKNEEERRLCAQTGTGGGLDRGYWREVEGLRWRLGWIGIEEEGTRETSVELARNGEGNRKRRVIRCEQRERELKWTCWGELVGKRWRLGWMKTKGKGRRDEYVTLKKWRAKLKEVIEEKLKGRGIAESLKGRWWRSAWMETEHERTRWIRKQTEVMSACRAARKVTMNGNKWTRVRERRREWRE